MEQVYLDYHAHAPIDPAVASALTTAYSKFDANPHSTHLAGERAHRAVAIARGEVAALLGAEPSEIIFASGATEANNLAIIGMMRALMDAGRPRLLVGAGEHASVLAAADAAPGAVVERLPLTPSGMIDLDRMAVMLDERVGMVSVAAANHEIGTLQPITKIAALAHGVGALLHSDLAQAAGHVPVDLGVLDLASLSAHKLSGPVGIGALYVRRKLRKRLTPMIVGGGQEGGLRAGSIPVPLCVAFGAACRIAARDMAVEAVRVRDLRDRLLECLAKVGGMVVNGGGDRLPGNINVSFEGVDGEALAMRVRGEVAISTGSACSSRSLEPSHVLAAIGVSPRQAEGAVRIGIGRATTDSDIEVAADALIAAVGALRATVRQVA